VNIAILVAGLPPDRIGGAEFQASRVAEHLAAQHQVAVYTRTRTIPMELATLRRCTVVRRCCVTVPVLRFGADIVRTLVLIGRERKTTDIILAYQTVIDGLIGVLAKALFGIPVVVAVRGEVEYQLARFGQSRWLTPFVLLRADRVVVQSPGIARDLVHAFERARRSPSAEAIRTKLRVIANGTASPQRERANGSAVLYVGRLTPEKGVKYLIEAMRSCPTEVLLIVGDGPDRSALERAAHALPNVSFAGMVGHANVGEYLNRAKVLVVPSLHEAQPNVIMEAMGRGVPVIASRVGGVPDLVRSGETGFLTKPGDASEIARYINLIAADADLRARMAQNCLAEMRHYAWPVVVDLWQRELMQVVLNRRSA
jgi:glycosyltransferase involved in cell wall biosynthesis